MELVIQQARPHLAVMRPMSGLVCFFIWVAGAGQAMAIETTSYTVAQSFSDFELRNYAGYLVAETEVHAPQDQAGNQAFGILAGYIFGKNTGQQKIEMTAPVTQTAGSKIAMTAPVTQTAGADGAYIVRFMMPSQYNLDTLPKPLDARVSIKQVAPQRVAALRYSGTWSQANYQEHLAELRNALKREAMTATSEPIWARYDPPWKPWFMRRNEILIPVELPAAR
jgi:hypothetical protein